MHINRGINLVDIAAAAASNLPGCSHDMCDDGRTFVTKHRAYRS